MFAPILTLALMLAAGLVAGLGFGIRAETSANGVEPARGLV